MFVLRIHEFDCDKCDVWLSVCVFGEFCENGSKEDTCDFDYFEWIHGVVVLS